MVSLGIARETKTKCAVHDLGTTPVGGACAVHRRASSRLAPRLWKLAKEMRGGKLWLAMVRAHGERRGGVRHEHNHAVDRLAAEGADGRVLSRADLAAGARD